MSMFDFIKVGFIVGFSTFIIEVFCICNGVEVSDWMLTFFAIMASAAILVPTENNDDH